MVYASRDQRRRIEWSMYQETSDAESILLCNVVVIIITLTHEYNKPPCTYMYILMLAWGRDAVISGKVTLLFIK